MMRPGTKVKKVYLYPKPVDFRKSIDGLSALVELDIKAAVFDPVLFVFLNRARNRVKILYWERNGFCLWLKRLEAERFKTPPDSGDEAIELTTEELNWMLDGFDLWRNRLHIPAHRDRLFRFIVTDFGCLPGIVGHDAGIIGHVPPESQPTHWNS